MPTVDVAKTLALAMNHHRAGRLADAERMYRDILRQLPDHAAALHHLGTLLLRTNRVELAARSLAAAIAANPSAASTHALLAQALQLLGRHPESVASLRRAVELAPQSHALHYNLANALRRAGELEGASECYRAAIALKPDFIEAHDNLGCVLAERQRYVDSVASFRSALSLNDRIASSWSNLADALKHLGRLDEAIDASHRAIALGGITPETYTNLASALRDQGRVAEAVEYFRQAVALNPAAADLHSNLIYTLWFHDGAEPEQIVEEHRRWDAQHARPVMPAMPLHPHVSSSNRLRIGYISPDFRQHVIGLLIEPVLERHDREGFEITCYASVAMPDAVTQRLQGYGHTWRNVAAMGDEAVAEQVHADKLDLLIDLASHMAHNRLLTVARRPAPVQASYLAYPATTGMSAIDYLISDVHLDPSGTSEHLYVERLARLPGSYWCYRADRASPPVAPAPAIRNGFVTFGSLNNFAKTSPATMQAWGRILGAVANSRLLVMVPGGNRGNAVVREMFARAGVSADRLMLVDRQPHDRYLALYNDIDIVLDPFPYNGHTTSIDALWMGCPLVTVAGRHSVARAGVSLLSNMDMKEWIAPDLDRYMALAIELSSDVQRLSTLRPEIRERLRNALVMDEAAHTRGLESIYLQIAGPNASLPPAVRSPAPHLPAT